MPTPPHFGSRTLTSPRCTDNWLCHLWSVHRTGDPRGVGSLRSHSVPFPRPPTAPELYPCAPGPNYPCNGRVSGSFLSVQLPARVLFTRVLKTGSLRYLHPMAQFDGQHPSSQGGCEARLVGLSHRKSNRTTTMIGGEFVHIGLLVPLCHRVVVPASPVYARA